MDDRRHPCEVIYIRLSFRSIYLIRGKAYESIFGDVTYAMLTLLIVCYRNNIVQYIGVPCLASFVI